VSELLTDREFAGYRIDGVLGRGGMGVVYRATELALDRHVALKVLAEELAEDPSFRRRFVAESKAAASLEHPNIVPVHAAGEHQGVLYLAMRLVPGRDLRATLRTDGRLVPTRAAQVIAQVASALDAAHTAGVIHRDVKPANVLIDHDGHAYLGDFGLSRRTGDAAAALTRSGQVLGTLDYIAPEQIRRETTTPQTDVYALGCVVFEVLTGEVPFPAETEEAKLWAHLSEPPSRLGDVVPGMPVAFDRAVRHALQKDPERRFASAGELAAALQDAAGGAQARTFEETRARARSTPLAAAPRAETARPRESDDRPHPGAPLLTSATNPFNLTVLVALLVIGVALGTPLLMAAMAAAVYGAGVAISYRETGSGRRHG
jgi:serine/threonine protein kinase